MKTSSAVFNWGRINSDEVSMRFLDDLPTFDWLLLNETQIEETTQIGDDRLPVSKVKQDDTLRNSPARIRTGDQTIMSRAL